MDSKQLVNFFHEVGFLKTVPRSGWFLIGKDNPESVAEHSFRTAVIGYFLAKREGVDYDKVMKVCLFHDMHETRTGDLNKVNQRYIDSALAEKNSFLEMISGLEDDELKEVYSDFKSGSREGVICKDADHIECALQAKEYIDQGYEQAWDWINNIAKVIRTDAAKELLELIKDSDSNEWWKGLKKIEG